MARKPWFKFWPEYELALRCVSPSACRVGISMLSLCNQSSRRGFALLSGRPASALQIARLAVADCTPDEAALWCRELCESAMASFNESDASFCIPRLVQDESEDGRDRENGKKGGNPRLANPLPTPCQPPPNPSLSSSCSSSLPSGSEGGRGETSPPAPTGQIRPHFDDDPPVLSHWLPAAKRLLDLYPRRMGGRAAVSAFAVALQAVADRGDTDPEAYLSQSVRTFAEAVKGKAPDFIPSPVTWARDGRYDDNHAAAYGGEPTQAEMSADLEAALNAGRKKR